MTKQTPTKRIRGRELQRIRKRILQRDPLCIECKKHKRVRASTQVDHIVPLYIGGEESDDNRQGLCDQCHEKKTRIDLGHRQRVAFDANGYPIDKDHHWNQ